MSEPLDDGVEKLRALCALLRTANPQLESGSADLQRLAHELSDAESRLATELDTLAIDVDELQKEATAGGTTSTQASQELGAAAETAQTGVVADVERHAAAVHDQWAQSLKDKTSALGTAFQDLNASGWEPLSAALVSEAGNYDHWTQGADEALGSVVQVFAGIAEGLQHVAPDVEGALHEILSEPAAQNAAWQDYDAHADRVLHETVPWFHSSVEPEASRDLQSSCEHLSAGVGDESGHVRSQLELTAQHAADALDGHANEVLQTLQDTVEALDRLQAEAERSEVQGDHAQAAASGVASVAPQVRAAEGLLNQIHEVTEAMKP